jgi:integrase
MSKRAHGEGTIRQRADGRWEARLTVDGKSKAFYGKTQREVRQKLDEAKRTVHDGLPLPPAALTVAAFLADWLAMKRPTIKGAMYTRYEQFVRCHIVPHLGAKPLAKLEPHDVTRLYAALAAPDRKPRPLSTGTIKLVAVMLRGALAYAVKAGLVARNVAAIAEPPRVVRAERPYLDGEQAKAFLAASAFDRLEALYMLAITVGMRQGELLALRWADVDLDGTVLRGKPSLYVCRSVRPIKGGFEDETPKTARSRRRVVLPLPAVEALRRHRAMQAEERLRAGALWCDVGLVFANERGGYIDRGNLQRRGFNRLLGRAGLPVIPFHSLRHTAITLMLQDGLDAGTIASIVGHADGGALIHRVYGHVTPAMFDRAVAAMNARFGS